MATRRNGFDVDVHIDKHSPPASRSLTSHQKISPGLLKQLHGKLQISRPQVISSHARSTPMMVGEWKARRHRALKQRSGAQAKFREVSLETAASSSGEGISTQVQLTSTKREVGQLDSVLKFVIAECISRRCWRVLTN